MRKKLSLLVSAIAFLGIGFLIGMYVANSGSAGLSAAEATDGLNPQPTQTPSGYMYGYGYPYGMNGSYYGGYGMGMMGPMYYPYAMNGYNGSYYGGYGMGMGMGMMGMMPMNGYGMYAYPQTGMDNSSYYQGYYGAGLCPGCGGGYGMYGYPYNYGNNPYPTPTPMTNMTSATSMANKAVLLKDGSNSDPSSANSKDAVAYSPFTVAGLGIGFIAFAPIAWKIMHRQTN